MKIKKVSGTAVLNGNVVDNLTDNSTENAPSQRAVNEEFISVKGKILWTNPNPNGAMEEITITLNSNDYDVYEIFAVSDTSVSETERRYYTSKTLKGKNTYLMFPNASNGTYRRLVNASNDGASMTFGGASGNNSFNVPLYIVGYKTGLFN